MSPTSIEDAEIRDRLRQYFLIPEQASVFSALERASETAPEHVRVFFQRFRQSVAAVIDTSAAPFTIAFDFSARALRRHHEILEILRPDESAIPVVPTVPEDQTLRSRESEARIAAVLRDRMATDDGKWELIRGAVLPLLAGHASGDLAALARELLLQGVVGLWSSFEVLVKDVLTTAINAEPSRARQVIDDAGASKYFEFPRIQFADLEAMQFDISTRVGTLIFGSKDFSDLRRLKAAAFAVFPADEQLRSVLNETSLWNLCQERHLIVHRRARVDERFLAATGRAATPESELEISPTDFRTRLKVVLNAGAALADASNILGGGANAS